MTKRRDYPLRVKDICQCLVDDHGGVRSAAREVKISASYFNRLLSGERKHPSDTTLRKLGLDTTPYFRLAIHVRRENSHE